VAGVVGLLLLLLLLRLRLQLQGMLLREGDEVPLGLASFVQLLLNE
jgi:hypothetical protein